MQYSESEQKAIQAIKDRYPSKQQMYTWMTVSCGKYLPPYEHTTLDFMFDIVAGRKLALKNDQLNSQQLPKFEEFTIDQIMDEMKAKPELLKYLPDFEGHKRKPCRKFVVTVLATKEPQFVKSSIEHAHKVRIEAKPLPETLDPIIVSPEFQKLLEENTFVTRGKRGKLLRGLRKPGAGPRQRKERVKRKMTGYMTEYLKQTQQKQDAEESKQGQQQPQIDLAKASKERNVNMRDEQNVKNNQ